MNAVTIAIVQSTFNNDITDKMSEEAIKYLQKHHQNVQLQHIKVPGAVEIPFMCQTLAQNQKPDAILTFGAVIFGQTDHYHYVCKMVTEGVNRVMLDHNIPIAFGVLTCKERQHALDRVNGNHSNMGQEAASCAMDMIALKQKYSQKIPAQV